MKAIKVFYEKAGEETIFEYRFPIDEKMLDNSTFIDNKIKRGLDPDSKVVGVVYPKSKNLQTI